MYYLRDPEAIYRKSFAVIRKEAHLSRLPEDIANIAVRLIHASGMTDIVDDLAFHPDAVHAGREALAQGAGILCDARMVSEGIIHSRLPAGNEVRCWIDHPDCADHAEKNSTTRSAAAIEFWRPHLSGAVAVIGNAPTALFRLLELLAEGAETPAVILGFPVGFVGAEESKKLLVKQCGESPPYLTLCGRRGGSAMAAAAVNALAKTSET